MIRLAKLTITALVVAVLGLLLHHANEVDKAELEWREKQIRDTKELARIIREGRERNERIRQQIAQIRKEQGL